MKKVLFFDIDGTLLNSELKIPEGVKRELKRLKEAGHYLFVASGRPLAFISNQIIEAGFNGFVLCNGAHVELNHEIIYENRIPYEKVNDLMKMLESVDTEENEKKMLHIEAIIQSMTQEERRKPSIIGASRKVRISKGSGTRVQDVNQLLKQFEQMQKMMKQLSGGRQAKMLKRLRKRK